MIKDLLVRARDLHREDPEKFEQNVTKPAIGVGVTALILVCVVNVASVITVFPF